MNELKKVIISEIKEKGPLTFENFMNAALYNKEYGYYSSGKVRIGKEGDFYTSPCVHPAFGTVLSNFISSAYNLMKVDQLNIVEIGSGKGFLALDILNALRSLYPGIYSNLRYTIVEPNHTHLEESLKNISPHEDKVVPFSDLKEFESPIEGIVLSNELFDSLPFHRLKFENNELKEIYVDYIKNKFFEKTGELSDERIIKYLDRYNIDYIDQQEIEVNINAGKMLSDIAFLVKKGVIITIDYGYLCEELFSPLRPNGTFKCHYRHQINENPYINIGNQDITAHVDFTNLISTGENLGFEQYIFREQGQFLVDWGIIDIIEQTTETDTANSINGARDRIKIKNLILPQLMGKVFKILIQFKDTGVLPGDFYPESKIKIV